MIVLLSPSTTFFTINVNLQRQLVTQSALWSSVISWLLLYLAVHLHDGKEVGHAAQPYDVLICV